jgi:hypothetical protein
MSTQAVLPLVPAGTPPPQDLPPLETKQDPKTFANMVKSGVSFTISCKLHAGENWLNCRLCNVRSKSDAPMSLLDMMGLEYVRATEPWRQQLIMEASVLMKRALAAPMRAQPQNLSNGSPGVTKTKSTSQRRRQENRKPKHGADHSAHPPSPTQSTSSTISTGVTPSLGASFNPATANPFSLPDGAPVT